MSTAIPSQHPAVVLRSQYNRLRNLLAIAMIAVVGLSVAVVVVSSDDAPSTSDVIATGKIAPAKNPSGTTRYDGGPEEGTRGAAVVSSAPVPTVAPPPSSIAAASHAEYEAMRKAQPNTRYDGGARGRHPRVDAVRVRQQRVRSRPVRRRASVAPLQSG